jgi:hypothetical protein
MTPQIVHLFAESRFDELADVVLSRFQGMEEALIGRVLPRAAAAESSRAVALERVARELARHAGAPNPAASFVLFHRTRRDIALLPTRVYRSIPNVVCPYLYPELFDLLYSLPPAYVVDHEFHDDTIRRAYPHVADVPYAQRAPAKVDRRQQYGFALEIAGMLRKPGSMELLEGSYVWPRILRALVDPTFLPAISTLGPRIVYLAELGLSAPGHSAVRAARRARRPARTAAS